jgi:hypothetical protein
MIVHLTSTTPRQSNTESVLCFLFTTNERDNFLNSQPHKSVIFVFLLSSLFCCSHLLSDLVIIQSSRSRQVVVMKSSDSRQAIVIRLLSSGRHPQAVIVRSPLSSHHRCHALIVRLSCSQQAVVRLLSGRHHQAVARKTSK